MMSSIRSDASIREAWTEETSRLLLEGSPNDDDEGSLDRRDNKSNTFSGLDRQVETGANRNMDGPSNLITSPNPSLVELSSDLDSSISEAQEAPGKNLCDYDGQDRKRRREMIEQWKSYDEKLDKPDVNVGRFAALKYTRNEDHELVSRGPSFDDALSNPNSSNNKRRTRASSHSAPNDPIAEESSQQSEQKGMAPKNGTPSYAGQPPYAPHIWERVPDRDPNQFYIEEDAWKYHNPPLGGAVSSHNLPALPEAPPLPTFPNTGECKWTFDVDTRVLLADFRDRAEITVKDEHFLLLMMERDDITLVIEGLGEGLHDLALGNIREQLGDEFYHKFRRFDQVGPNEYMEVDGMLSMRLTKFMEYLERRRKYLNRDYAVDDPKSSEVEATDDCQFTFKDHKGKDQSINVVKTILYMIDFDIVKLLPKFHHHFSSSFKLPGIMPGGTHCMMNSITSSGRPFMGPNLYVTSPRSFTHFHQDGHGTVDSGHFCCSGFNEVIMLRRLTERHKQHALSLLNGASKYKALYNLPHGDTLGDRPSWPDLSKIEDCKEMGYCPSVFILRPGQHVHINKGRIHAFRKLAPETLPPSDCHAKLRQEIVDVGSAGESLCVSVAWDWMYRGITREGINREVTSMLECAELNRRHAQQSLALPELALLQMARTIPARMRKDPEDEMWKLPERKSAVKRFAPSDVEVVRGILPGLRYIVKQHLRITDRVELQEACQGEGDMRDRVRVEPRPKASESRCSFSLDPYGAGDFFCKLCYKELSNLYLRCDGCDHLVGKDFNICFQCHSEGRYKVRVQMHDLLDKVVHAGHITRNILSDNCLSKKAGKTCESCGFCSCCSCKCHTNFHLSFRFFTKTSEEILLQTFETVAGVGVLEEDHALSERLQLAATGGFDVEVQSEAPDEPDDSE